MATNLSTQICQICQAPTVVSLGDDAMIHIVRAVKLVGWFLMGWGAGYYGVWVAYELSKRF